MTMTINLVIHFEIVFSCRFRSISVLQFCFSDAPNEVRTKEEKRQKKTQNS